jgi:acyl carrier protein
MMQQDKILSVVFNAVDEVNEQLPPERQLAKTSDTSLLGREATLDSLGLVNLVVATEQNIEEEFGVTLTLADERAMSQSHSPFRTIGTLVEYIALLLEESHG